ncbi:GNAT family N-acetyltransferase [Streptomyces sp. NPDC058572]|uniref:GNAT family N-acetyltransferase n=1 Tax=Streptomyces sp. NPDC058572 TaxID=3346546 RepID=UPI00364D3053
MIPLVAHQVPDLSPWFPLGDCGPATLPEHVRATGVGKWWADDPARPRAVAVACAGHVLLGGEPQALSPKTLAPLAGHCVVAPNRFLPVLGAAFGRIQPWERMIYTHRVPAAVPRPPRGVSVRRLTADDAPALAGLSADMAWIHASWGGPSGLAASGFAWGAFHKDQVLAVACTYFLGSAYEDIACVTVPGHRRERLSLSCVIALCADIAARGRRASWTCSRDNRPSRLLAWTAGFRLEREYVHHVTGASAGSVLLAA